MPRFFSGSNMILLGSLSLLSAFLLFQVQPVISKFILPWFGGSPGVWTTCMLFFQAVLFAGYSYAHVLTRLRPRYQSLIHGGLILLALVFLPIAPDDSWKPTGTEDPSMRILLLLLGTVGLPYFVLSSTSPLAQVWFTRAEPGGRPWRLYALSNVGSLAALLSYPFFFEVHWDVISQTWIWSAAFVAFAILSFVVAWRDGGRGEAKESAGETAVEAAPVTKRESAAQRWANRLLWVLLPACASAMLLSATNHVSQDVAVVPFMWVIPLSLYLLTFIICFEHERWYWPVAWTLPAAAVLFAAGTGLKRMQSFVEGFDLEQLTLPGGVEAVIAWAQGVPLTDNFVAELALSFGAVFLGCMVCHGELARLKPHPSRLTEFYLLMSAGGALGGVAVSLGAPRVFETYLEWPLSVLVTFVIAVIAFAWWAWQRKWIWLGIPLAALALYGGWTGANRVAEWRLKVDEELERVRNFYGAVYVSEDYDTGLDSPYRTLTHGGIIHGMQNLAPDLREEPVTYYGRHTGIGRALESLGPKPDARVGVVGMGTATVACYGQIGHTYRFYEINPEIPRLARKHFTFLADMEKRGGKVEVVIGDARLSLEREPSQQFDVLLLDAFSGDAIPFHLITREAFQIYQRHMKPDGIIAVHATNTYLALAPVVEKQAEAMGWQTSRITTNSDGDHDITDYVLVTRNQDFLAKNPTEISDTDKYDMKVPVWTDRYHNLFQILIKKD